MKDNTKIDYQDLRGIIEYLKLTDINIIGHSMGAANWRITKELMNPALSSTPKKFEPAMISMCRGEFDPFTVAAMWYSLCTTHLLLMEKPNESAECVKKFLRS